MSGAIGKTDPDDSIHRMLEVFSNETDELITEYKLINFDLAKFRAWFGEDGSDPQMFYCYDVGEKDTGFLSAYITEPVTFDFIKYGYYVSAYMKTEDWIRKYGTRKPS